MLKNKFKIITILTILIMALTLPTVRAVEVEADGNETAVDTTVTDETATTTNDEDNFKKSDIYLMEDEVVIDYIVDGNLFVLANNVTINSQIGGDAFICAKNITIGEQGYIFSNLFAVSDNITINGVVYDLYSASKTTNINGYIYRDARSTSNSINILGTVGRNAYLNFGSINLTAPSNEENVEQAKGVITGNLVYSSNQEANIPEGIVGGEINFEKSTTSGNQSFSDYIISLGTFVASVLIIWLVCLWLAPKLVKNNSSLITTKKILPVIGFGILTPIVLTILSIILFVIGITSSLAFLLLAIMFILFAISTSIFVITLNNVICEKLNITKLSTTFGILVITSIILWLICLIPYVGSIIGILILILGLGIIVSKIFLKDEETSDTKKNTKSKKEKKK